MIYELNGTHEIPQFKENTHVCIYQNNIDENYPPHWHSPIEILMPIENNYTMVVNNHTYVVEPYELLIIGPSVVHSSIAPESGYRYFFQIEVTNIKNITGINTILSLMGQASHFTPENHPDIHRRLVKLFEEICDEYYNSEKEKSSGMLEESNLLCEPIIYSKFLAMLTLIGRSHLETVSADSINQNKSKEYADKIMKVCSYIDEHFTEDLTLEEVASMAGYSKYHFARIFKIYTNNSFYRYVNQHRIAMAEELLSNPEVSITQIAISCGFSTTSAFIRMFKQFNECTPSDFRKLREKYSFSGENRQPTVRDENE